MVIATIFFWAGRKKFVHIPPAGLGFLPRNIQPGRSLRSRVALFTFRPVFWSFGTKSSGGSWTLQAETTGSALLGCRINMSFSPFHISAGWGLELLAAQVQTANPILILFFIPLVNYVIYPCNGALLSLHAAA